MPEIVDLEVYKETLLNKFKNKSVINFHVFSSKSNIQNESKNFHKILNKKLLSFDRIGKVLIFQFEQNQNVAVHFMLTGGMRIQQDQSNSNPFDLFLFYWENQTSLVFFDKNGWLKVEFSNNIKNCSLLKDLGTDALKMSYGELLEKISQNKLMNIKSFLLDQKIFSGIGNAFADEILFLAKIRPNRKLKTLSGSEIKNLFSSIFTGIQTGIKHTKNEIGDSLVESERKWMNVHNKVGKPCPICKKMIVSLKICGKQSFYCTACQI